MDNKKQVSSKKEQKYKLISNYLIFTLNLKLSNLKL